MDYGFRIEKVLARLPGPQGLAIDSFGDDVSMGILDIVSMKSGINEQDHYLDLADQALCTLVWKGLEQSKVGYRYKDTASDRLAIGKLASPIIKAWVAATPQFDHDKLERVAVGLVGVHAAIWLPENAMQGAAKSLFTKARETIANKTLKPFYNEYLARDQE